MRIDEGLDTGDILLKSETAIQDDDSTETLGERLSRVGADLMVETLRRLEQQSLPSQPQDHAQASLAPMLKKEDGHIDWNLSAVEIWNRVRGLRPWPGAFTEFRGRYLHIWAAHRPAPETMQGEPGTLLAGQGRLRVICGQGTLLDPSELQLEGRKRLPVRDFLNGMKIAPGEKAV
jgi:methionyl-tRNA formyltransferase